MIYDTTHECRYHKADLFLEEEEAILTEDEKESVRHFLYQEDVQYIFGGNVPTETDLQHLETALLPCAEWMTALQQVSAFSPFAENNNHLGLCILLSYDYLYLSHPCISSYLDNGTIPPKVFEELVSHIK